MSMKQHEVALEYTCDTPYTTNGLDVTYVSV
jgi:hypothetical protein